MAESVEPDTLSLARNSEFLQGRVKDSLHNLVPTKGPAAPVHEDKFVLVVYEVRLELRLERMRHRDGVLRFLSLRGHDLTVPNTLAHVNQILVEAQVFDP